MKRKKLTAALTALLLCACTDTLKPGDVMDGDGMIRDFFSYDLKGTWHEIWPGRGETLIFSKDTVRQITVDGREADIAYQIEDGSELRSSDHVITLDNAQEEYSELIYQDHETGQGLKGYLFAVWPITGDEDPYQTVKIFQHEEDRNDYTDKDLPQLTKK
jgi:hypothetical protein